MSYSEKAASYLARFASQRALFILLYREALASSPRRDGRLLSREPGNVLARRLDLSAPVVNDELWRLHSAGWLQKVPELGRARVVGYKTLDGVLLCADVVAKRETGEEWLVTRSFQLHKQKLGLPPAPPPPEPKPLAPIAHPPPPPPVPFADPGGRGPSRRWNP